MKLSILQSIKLREWGRMTRRNEGIKVEKRILRYRKGGMEKEERVGRDI